MLKINIKKMFKIIFCAFFLLVVVLLAWLNFAQIRLTTGGVYESLTLPIFNNQGIKLNAFYAAQADKPALTRPALHGPIIKTFGDKLDIHWYCHNQHYRKLQSKQNRQVKIECNDKVHQVQLHKNTDKLFSDYLLPQHPQQTIVTSDLHGRHDYFIEWAKELKIIDNNHNWSFGSNHVVVLGDFVDKGPEVFALLWKLYELEAQAEQAGGKLHLVLGNHEQYILRGLFTRVAPEQLYAIEQMMPFKEAFSEETTLGQWLRTKPVMIKIGQTLMVHAGISQTVVNQALTLEDINQKHTRSLKQSSSSTETLFFSSESITRYRGYVTSNARYEKANQKLIDDTLSLFDAEHIVVGHTGVDELVPRFNGKVYAIDNTEMSSQTLQFINGSPSVIITKTLKPPIDPTFKERQFSLFHSKDWIMLGKLMASLKTLNQNFGH